jgi:hypothetical protein
MPRQTSVANVFADMGTRCAKRGGQPPRKTAFPSLSSAVVSFRIKRFHPNPRSQSLACFRPAVRSFGGAMPLVLGGIEMDFVSRNVWAWRSPRVLECRGPQSFGTANPLNRECCSREHASSLILRRAFPDLDRSTGARISQLRRVQAAFGG